MKFVYPRGSVFMKFKLIIGLIWLAASALAEATSPSAAEIEKGVLAFANEVSKGGIALSAFRKTDGMTQQDGSYVADYSAEISFLKCGDWKPARGLGFGNTGTRAMSFRLTAPFEGCPAEGERNPWDETLIAIKVGKDYATTINGQALMLKKESGWKVQDAWVNFDSNGAAMTSRSESSARNVHGEAASRTVPPVKESSASASSTMSGAAADLLGIWTSGGTDKNAVSLEFTGLTVGDRHAASIRYMATGCTNDLELTGLEYPIFEFRERPRKLLACGTGAIIRIELKSSKLARAEQIRPSTGDVVNRVDLVR